MFIPSLEKALTVDIALGMPIGGLFRQSIVPKTLRQGGYEELEECGYSGWIFDLKQLNHIKVLFKNLQANAVSAVEELGQLASEILAEGLSPVTDKSASLLSTDPHDFQSLAKYIWIGPVTGLRIRRDGVVNPACYGPEYDSLRLVAFSEKVVLLSLAEFFLPSRGYGAAAEQFCKAWFLDRQTFQTPHFKFAQAPEAGEEGGYQGIIEARHLIYVTEAVCLLEKLGSMQDEVSAGIRRWFESLLAWMESDERIVRASQSGNNLSYWVDLQRASYYRFTGDEEQTKLILRESNEKRIIRGMALDGELVTETSRKNPVDYVTFSLVAMALMSRLDKDATGTESWISQTSDGRSFHVAHEWLLRRSLSSRVKLFRGQVEFRKTKQHGFAYFLARLNYLRLGKNAEITDLRNRVGFLEEELRRARASSEGKS
jgi:hypothetical protein